MKKEFNNFLEILFQASKQSKNFKDATYIVNEYIDSLTRGDFIYIVSEIGTIPEIIKASSTEEKLYSKASDIVLSRCFIELGLKSKAVTERSNSADVLAESIHGYTLVADAKTFRLSRTAKNQKDFKIANLSNWRGMENDYAILVSPYFQYPSTTSQIYASALEGKVCLLSWEHMLFLINNNNNIEDSNFSLEQIWNAPTRIVRDTKIAFADRMNCFFPFINKMICDRLSIELEVLTDKLNSYKINIKNRSKSELKYLKNELKTIQNLSKDEAITELIKYSKLNEKINAIESYMNSLK